MIGTDADFLAAIASGSFTGGTTASTMGSYAEELVAVKANFGTALTAAQAEKDTAVAAQKVTDDEALAAAKTQAATDQAAAVTAATAPLEAQIDTLTTQVAALQTQLSGSAGAYQVTVSPIQLAVLGMIAAQTPNGTVAGSLNSIVYEYLNGIALLPANQEALFGAAMGRFPGLDAATQGQILAEMELDYLGVLAPENLVKQLSLVGLPTFLTLDPSAQARIFVLLGLGA